MINYDYSIATESKNGVFTEYKRCCTIDCEKGLIFSPDLKDMNLEEITKITIYKKHGIEDENK